MAEGVLHEFEGWVIFMVSSVALVLIAVTLNRTRGKAVAAPQAPPAERSAERKPLALPLLKTVPRSFFAATALVAIGATLEVAVPQHPEAPPARSEFAEFPLHLAGWSGQKSALEPSVLELLKLDDYLLADFRNDDGPPVNLYVAFYQSQRGGMTIHSPARCIPAGGWQIRSFARSAIPAKSNGGRPWPVNRVLIETGNQRALVYYWFQERGRRLTSEYLVRWYLFWDSLTVNRTDGALIRLVVPIAKDADIREMDARLARFAATSEEPLSRFVPY